MLKIERILDKSSVLPRQPYLSLTLPHERRIISRQRVTLDDGSDAGLFLPRGSNLQHGDVLQGASGELIRVQAAAETVSTLYCDDPLLLARACYHLGNRHVPLQIAPGLIRYQHDHVLDEMLHGMGLHVVVEQAPFEPEAGAYAGGHSHSHEHSHAHGHGHSHDY
ncbi:MAG: urease accessory protein UreE [Candidatus Thiothrix singaporensis]|uniref:Urease accessory protein UreE n=1 Tax=Candidatus Thiothrix singaporensis TaxID=2799669 RepID=A0A7L6ATC9_9GAMM|nr:MAG: urease accessory protein UreE [Candidatus Thiothrix singaporensis]